MATDLYKHKRHLTPNSFPQPFDPGAHHFLPRKTPLDDTDGDNMQDRTSREQLSGSASNSTSAQRNKMINRLPPPLYSSSVWSVSADSPIRSAPFPEKSSWDGVTMEDRHMSSFPPPFTPHSRTSFTPGTHPPIPAVVYTPHGPVSSDKLSPGGIRYTQTAEYHNTPSSARAPHSAPLPQAPFDWHDHAAQTSSYRGSIPSNRQFTMPGTPGSSAPTHAPPSASGKHPADDQQSSDSGSIVISEHYTLKDPEKVGKKGDVWAERTHPHSLRPALKDPNVKWVEAYPGALQILTALNPEQYQMPWGTRVVNIKTEYPGNVLRSIRSGKYSVMRSVSERIMRIWNAREDAGEKVLFLFSVNGSKRYCGLAVMSGPWNPHGSIESWENNPDPEKSEKVAVGFFPVTWVYVKDVAYHQFNHIRQERNQSPVGNMWNGMNFPSDTGRQVIEVYVKTPATDSILCHKKGDDFALAPYRISDGSGYGQQRGNPSFRGTRGGRGGYRGGAAQHATNWRVTSNVYSGSTDDEPTPTATARPQLITASSNNSVPAPSIPFVTNADGQKISLGAPLSVKLNEHGQLIVVVADPDDQEGGSSGAASERSLSQAGKNMPVCNQPVSRTQMYGFSGPEAFNKGLHGARSLNSLRLTAPTLHTLPETSPLHHGHMAGADPGASRNGALGHPHPVLGGMSMQHYPVQTSQLSQDTYYYGSRGHGSTRTGEDTPTHRPASRTSRGSEVKTTQTSSSNMDEDLLKAKFHALSAEQFGAQHELRSAVGNQMTARLLNAKLSRIQAEKREVQAEMAMRGFADVEVLSSVRHDSFSSDEGAQTSSTAYTISPVRAEDGRVLRSASKFGSPDRREPAADAFDKAPGGSGRQKGHAFTKSYDLRMKKSITDLINSPKKSPPPAKIRPTQETSSFFADNAGNGSAQKTQSYTLPYISGNRPSVGYGTGSYSFHAGSPKVGGGTKNFSYRLDSECPKSHHHSGYEAASPSHADGRSTRSSDAGTNGGVDLES